MALSNSQRKPQTNSPALARKREELFRLFQSIESSAAILSSSDERQVAQAIDELTRVLEGINQQQDSQALVPPPVLRVVAQPPDSPIQPVQEILNCIPDSHVVTSSDGRIQLANEQAARLFHLAQQELPGLSLSQFIPEDDWSRLLGRLRNLGEDIQSWQGEISISPTGRDTRSVVCTLSALRDTRDGLVGVHWLLWDVTEHRAGMVKQELSHEIGQLLLAGMTIDQALSVICCRLAETFEYRLVLMGVKEISGTVRVVAQSGDPSLSGVLIGEKGGHAALTVSAMTRAIEHNIIQVHHLEDHDQSPEADQLREQGMNSQIIVPLASEDHVLGVLIIGSQQSNAFDEGIVGWLEELSVQIGKAVSLTKDHSHLRLQEHAMNISQHAVCITSPEGRIEWVNDAYGRLSGCEAFEVIGTVLPSSQSKLFKNVLKRANKRQPPSSQSWKTESVGRRKDGRSYTVEETLTPLLDEAGNVSNIVVIFQDITARTKAEAKIIHRVYHDPLTDLPNRVMFYDRLDQALAQARRHQRLLSVVFIDLDCFKQVNDVFGHRVGDQLLKVVAERLTHCVRATDTVARLSGDEFTLLLQDLERENDAQHVAQKILDCLVEPVQVGGHTLHVRTSIGIALFPTDATEPEALLQRADRAMYKAKEQGGQGWVFASDDQGQKCV